jgi:hypothetical protein
VGAMGAGGCDAEEAVGFGEAESVQMRAIHTNALELNSAKLNGWTLNGIHLNGWTLNGWTLNGWTLNGWTLNGWTLNGSALMATYLIDGESIVLRGPDLIGSELTLVGEGQSFTLRFDDIFKDPSDPEGDVYFHRISVHDPISDTWSSLCHDVDGQPTEAIAIANTWDLETGARIDDPAAVTLACRGAALAKCVEWGYRPWASATRCKGAKCEVVSLADHHQACTRMARADYCGDGTPHTFDATPVDVYDRLSAPIQDEATAKLIHWDIEAEWGPDGALCLGDALRLHMYDELGVDHEVPPCLAKLAKIGGCGNFNKKRDALIANRYCSVWQSDPTACESLGDEDECE